MDFGKKYSSYKSRAKIKGIAFEFTKDQFIKKAKEPCYICGKKPEGIHGLDRLDSNNGYYDFNTESCCWNCNRAKSNMSRDEFEDWTNQLGITLSEKYWKAMDRVNTCDSYNTKDYKEALIARELESYMKTGKSEKKGIFMGSFRKWKTEIKFS